MEDKRNFQLYAYYVFKIALSIMCMDRAIFSVGGRLSRPVISTSVRLVGILPVSLFLIPLYHFVHGFGFGSSDFLSFGGNSTFKLFFW